MNIIDYWVIGISVCIFCIFIKYDDKIDINNKKFLVDVILAVVPPIFLVKMFKEIKEFFKSRN